jgi:hypothetical protein
VFSINVDLRVLTEGLAYHVRIRIGEAINWSRNCVQQQENDMSTKAAHHPHHNHVAQTNTGGTGERPAENTAPANTKDGQEERFHLIQVHAYGLWEQAGKPNDDGPRVRFWQEAEKAIAASCSPQD